MPQRYERVARQPNARATGLEPDGAACSRLVQAQAACDRPESNAAVHSTVWARALGMGGESESLPAWCVGRVPQAAQNGSTVEALDVLPASAAGPVEAADTHGPEIDPTCP